MPEKTLQVLCELAVNWETQVRDLYKNFAYLLSHETKVSHFWMEVSKDESEHIEVLKDILNKMSPEKRSMKVSYEHWNSVARVEELIKEASKRKIQTLDDAYELADKLEISEVNTLFKMLVNDYVSDEQGRLLILLNVTEHVQKFMTFGKEYTQSLRKTINVRSI